jgi:peptidoglycan/xylan/chitin deacetylase (PgdA/CDA1 family)
MTIKVNYNYVAAFFSLCLVLLFCLFEPESTPAARADAEDGKKLALPVAMYHHILETPSKWGNYVISPAQFREDMEYLRACGYTTVTAKQVLDYADGQGDLPEKPILITFDDAYESVYAYAYPVLKEFGMKAVVSVIGRYTDLFSDPEETKHINYSHLNWEQLREMQESGVFEVGNHTYDMHWDGSSGKRYGIRKRYGESLEAYREALLGDVYALSEQMEKELGEKPVVFAYPFGALCEESRPILEEMGFRIILTCEEKVNQLSPGTKDPIVLKRFNRPHRDSTAQYYKKLGIVPQQ